MQALDQFGIAAKVQHNGNPRKWHVNKRRNVHPEMDGVTDANGLAEGEELAAVKEGGHHGTNHNLSGSAELFKLQT